MPPKLAQDKLSHIHVDEVDWVMSPAMKTQWLKDERSHSNFRYA